MSATGLAEALFARLNGVGGVVWYPLRLPEGATLPAGVYQRIDAVPVHVHGAVLALRSRRYQLTIYSEKYLAGLTAARAVQASIGGTRADWSGWTVSALLVDDAEDIDPEPRGLFRQRVDVMLTSEAP